MKHYNNIPQAIRKGIFCFMAGSMVFLANETVAEAKEGDNNSSSEEETDNSNVNTPGEDASSEEETDNSNVNTPSEDISSENSVKEEA